MQAAGNSRFVEIMSKILRPLNFLGGIGAIVVGFLVLLVGGATFRTLLNLVFTTVLGVLLLAGEFNLNVVNENCKFLATFLGRGFYDIFVGGWIFGLHSYFGWHHDSGHHDHHDNPLNDIGYLTSLCVALVIQFHLSFLLILYNKIIGVMDPRSVFHYNASLWQREVYL